jgi:ABC-type multidrug transport system ATPase subunit
MSQRLSLYAELSVFENLRFRAAVYGLRNPRASAEAAMRDFNLVPWAHSPAASLSGGWARRLQLAASLLHSPQLVLLDEPTAGLDATARQDVWRRVEGLAAAGAGVIVSTHDLAEAERCSHTAFFANGQVVAAGTPAAIAAGSPAAVFLLSGTNVRRLANDVTAVAGVVTSCPQGACLRVVADPLAELELRRFAAIHAASLSRAEARLEDAVLARSLSTGSRQT